MHRATHNETEAPARTGRFAPVAKRVGAVVFWLGVWQLAALAVGNDLLLVGPLGTVRALASLVVTARFWSVVANSFAHIVAGFVIAYALALVLAALAWRSSAVRTLLKPLMDVIKSTPVVCFIVLLLIWFGSRTVPIIAVMLVVMPAVYFSALGGFDGLDLKLDEMLSRFEVGRMRRLGAYIWPGLLPHLIPVSELVCGMSWKAGVAAELIGVPLGTIGERVYQSKLLLDTGNLFSWTFVVIALAFACERLFLWALRRSGAWSARRAARGSRAFKEPEAQRTRPSGFILRDATLGYGSERPVALHLDLVVPTGSRLCLADPSGSGKTTLLYALAGLGGMEGGNVPSDALRPSHISMVFQEARLIEDLDARGNMLLICGRWATAAMADALLAELLPADALKRPVRELSGGQRRRVELARALAFPSQALLLDEPFASLDSVTRRQSVACLLAHLAGRTLVLASHEADDPELLAAQSATPFAP